ncbi:hypothetical protein I316_01555 [Kwoniella heveanensis BCC8398]|uniref:Uncharacterized protein n=1 Tax=Kwoniella heveanensis BCC8398 TaxID=1296120 RepID=A0A1B9H128_9TREE|nr:hypothetical protein I316_01555 [Kwoniella heveanensis BCC8398]
MTTTARCTRDLSHPCVTLALELNQMIENGRPRVIHRKRLIERLLEFDPESCLAESRRDLALGSATRDPFDEPEGAHPSLLLSHDIGRYAAMMENVTRRFQSLYEIEGRSKAVTGPSGERPSDLALKTIKEGLDMLDRICEASAAHRRLLQLELSSLTCDPTNPSLTTLIKEVYTRTAHEGETRQSFVDLVRPYSEDKLPWSTRLIEEATASTRDYRDRLSAMNEAVRSGGRLLLGTLATASGLLGDPGEEHTRQSNTGEANKGSRNAMGSMRQGKGKERAHSELTASLGFPEPAWSPHADGEHDRLIERLRSSMLTSKKHREDTKNELRSSEPLIRATRLALPQDHSIHQSLKEYESCQWERLQAEQEYRELLPSLPSTMVAPGIAPSGPRGAAMSHGRLQAARPEQSAEALGSDEFDACRLNPIDRDDR